MSRESLFWCKMGRCRGILSLRFYSSIILLRVFPVGRPFAGIGNLDGRGSCRGGLREETREGRLMMEAGG